MNDLHPYKKRICIILRANQIQYPSEFTDSTRIPPSQEAWAMANSLINVIELLVDYSVNNGFKQFESEIKTLMQIVIDISPVGGTVDKGTLKKHRKVCDKKIEKIIKAGVLNKHALDAYKLSPDYSLDISKCVCKCIEETIADGKIILDEIKSIDKSSYESEFSTYAGGTLLKSYDKWQADCSSVIERAEKLLLDIQTSVQNVLDESSQKAADSATEIIGCILKWRKAVVRSYLFLDESMLEHLIGAEKCAVAWSKRLVGVVNTGKGEQVGRASTGSFYKRGDELSGYISARPSVKS